MDIPLVGQPVWIAGIPFEDGVAWAVATENGNLQAFHITPRGYTTISITPEQLPPGMPLTIYAHNGQLFALVAPSPDASPLSPPIVLESKLSKLAYIAQNGDLVIWEDGTDTRLPVNAMPDSHLITDEHGRLLLLTHPTERYAHGVLGDSVEAAGIALVATHPEPIIVRSISIPEPDVIEGIAPLWRDLNSDGALEIIVTLSNENTGARIVVFDEDGSVLAEGPPVGKGFRWRHQLLVAPLDLQVNKLLAVVRTPHIGGVLEFYRLNGSRLELVFEAQNISTHRIGSRNLSTALAGDFDQDGLVELLAPDQRQTRFRLVGLDDEEIWLELGAELSSNLAAVGSDSGIVSIGAGLSNGTLRIWLP